jgi:phospholipid-translocating ATPase
MFETHYKTNIVLISFFVTTIGWWGWNAFLSAVYARSSPIYKVRDGFTDTFGPDPLWWTTLFGVLAVMGLVEMVLKILKRRLIGFGLYNVESWLFWKKKSRNSGGGGLEGEGGRQRDREAEWEVEIWQELEKDGGGKGTIEGGG